jgi:hypothetical protein
VNGRGERCLSVGGVQIDQAVTTAFLAAVALQAWPPTWAPPRPWKRTTTPL